jgi:hypothetical protein
VFKAFRYLALIDNVTLTMLLNYYHSKKLWQMHGDGTIKFGGLFIYHIMLTYIKMKGLMSSRFSIPNGISQQLLGAQKFKEWLFPELVL